MTFRSTARRAAFGLAAALAIAPGCMTPGGTFYSADSHTFVSTEWQPWTVTLIDTRTGEPVWSVDVPVGKELTVRFRAGSGPNENKPDMMSWGIAESKSSALSASPTNQIPVPGKATRRLETTLRHTPEMPGAMPSSKPAASAGSAAR